MKYVITLGALVLFALVLVFIFGTTIPWRSPMPTSDTLADTTDTLYSGSTRTLSKQGLTSVPMSVFTDTTIEVLDISHNALTGALPSQIQNLKNLRVLRANNNQMTGVPAEVGHLKNLEVLDLSHNQLTGLPYELGQLTNLKMLNLSGNAYSKEDLAVIQAQLPNTQFILE